jgi:hypothetical protein
VLSSPPLRQVPPVRAAGAVSDTKKDNRMQKQAAARWGGVRYMALCAGMVAIAGTCAQAQLGTIANWGEPIAIQGTPSGTFRQVSGGWDTALGFVSMAPSSTGAHRSSSRPCFSTSMNFENTFRSTTRRIRSSLPGDRRGPFDQFRGSAQRRG